MKKLLKRMIAAAISTAMLIGGTAYAEPVDSEEEIVMDAPESAGRMVYLPNDMRGVMVTPTVDFYIDAPADEQLVTELSEMYESISSFGMNTVLINTDYEETAFYNLEINQANTGVLGAAINQAHEHGLFAYAVLDVNNLITRLMNEGGGLKKGFSAAVHKFVMRYSCDGILLTNYYTADSPEMFSEYMRSGSGIGYENWLYETNQYIIRSISEIIARTNNTVAVGLLINDMWANYTTTDGGSVTADPVQSLYDGFCDTKAYLESGYADFVIVKAYGSTSDSALRFDNVMSWWYDLCEKSGSKLYMLHLNEKIGSGWNEDQLLRQLTIMEDYENAGGSVFNSLASLKADPLGSTKTLMEYFSDKINTDTIFNDLTMVSPSSLSFVTYDDSVKFMGTFDENFDVFFDGEKIRLNDVGNFYFQKELKVGSNSFTIEHKGKQYRYSIERRVDVLRSIEQEKDITVEGGTKIALVAVAYSGASVSATIGGKTVKLKERSSGGEDLDANSSYAKFVGYYRVGDGIISQEQYLGEISFYASYKGSEEYMTGGSVTIAALPEPPKEDLAVEIMDDQSSAGTGEVVGRIDPILTESDNVTYIKVLNNFTTVFDAKTTGNMPSPIFSQLPAGTLDYYKSASGGYITTTSGRRFNAADVTTFYDTGLGENALVVKEIGNSAGNSFIKLGLRYRSSFNIETPVDYHEDLDGMYGVSNYNSSVVYITFDNITSVTKLPSFDYCTLFSAGEWETITDNGIPKFRLKLTLRQAGIYSGAAARYDENGDLVLSFAVPTATLAGKVIVIDPGHGYGKTPDKLDPGAVGNVTEQSVNLAVAIQLEQKLTAMGATVVRLKTESEFILTETRPNVARTYGADMFISLHCNSVLNEEAHGVEVYYFTPFSQPLASGIQDSLCAYYDSSIYSDGTNSNRGEKYSYYWVTLQQDFPSVLVEMGFISNPFECMKMADPVHQAGIAQAIADGVKSYFARSVLSYSGSGSDAVPDDVPSTPDIPVTPEPPETPDTPDVPDDNPDPESPDVQETADAPDEPDDETKETTETPAESEEPDDNPFGGIPVI
ncbi:MAG: N-acetylmuramoyl-L-alanine amidase [Oscillospiraceae bacterium]